MSVTVVDASALTSVLLDEATAGEIKTLLAEQELAATSLLPFEIANVCAMKARQFPEKRSLFLLAIATFSELPIRLHQPDVESIFELAGLHKLTAYDASYLWLAKKLGAKLVTLDKELAAAYAKS
jgi:predicted nucleic acid-binding protein